jgi:hypothetical protein
MNSGEIAMLYRGLDRTPLDAARLDGSAEGSRAVTM